MTDIVTKTEVTNLKKYVTQELNRMKSMNSDERKKHVSVVRRGWIKPVSAKVTKRK